MRPAPRAKRLWAPRPRAYLWAPRPRAYLWAPRPRAYLWAPRPAALLRRRTFSSASTTSLPTVFSQLLATPRARPSRTFAPLILVPPRPRGPPFERTLATLQVSQGVVKQNAGRFVLVALTARPPRLVALHQLLVAVQLQPERHQPVPTASAMSRRTISREWNFASAALITPRPTTMMSWPILLYPAARREVRPPRETCCGSPPAHALLREGERPSSCRGAPSWSPPPARACARGTLSHRVHQSRIWGACATPEHPAFGAPRGCAYSAVSRTARSSSWCVITKLPRTCRWQPVRCVHATGTPAPRTAPGTHIRGAYAGR